MLELGRKFRREGRLFLCRSIIGRYIPLAPLFIEITTYCNLKCRGCYRTLHDYSEKNKHMSLNDFKFYIDNTPPASSLVLHGLGEPTLHPDLVEIIKYAKSTRRYLGILFNTNAVAKPPEFFEELFANGLGQLGISVDSLNPKEVEQLRLGTSIERLKENIKYLSARFPKRIFITMVISKINFNTAHETLYELQTLGIRRITFQLLEDVGDATNCLSSEERYQFFNKMNKFISSKHFSFLYNFQDFFHPKTHCTSPYIHTCITVGGYLTPCCKVFDKDVFNYGCLKDRSFNEIFFSKDAKLLRKSISQGNYPDFCKNCVPFSFD